jgi:hypothetical protein
MQVSDATCATMTKLVELGYAITNIYGDGAVRMAISTEDDDTMSVFVRDDTITPPATYKTQMEQARLVGEGLTIRVGPRKDEQSLLHAQNRDRIESDGAWQ